MRFAVDHEAPFRARRLSFWHRLHRFLASLVGAHVVLLVLLGGCRKKIDEETKWVPMANGTCTLVLRNYGSADRVIEGAACPPAEAVTP